MHANRSNSRRCRGYFGARQSMFPLLARSKRVIDWPKPDQTAWAIACTQGGLLDRPGPAAHLAPATQRICQAAWGRYLTFLDHIGELDETSPPRDRMTPERRVAYIESMRPTLSAHTIYMKIVSLQCFLRYVAPDHDWHWVRSYPGTPTQREVRASKKPIHVPDVVALTNLAIQLCDTADDGRRGITNALRFRDGVIILVLVFHAIRLKNLAEMRLGTHVLIYDDHVRLVFDTTVKNQEIIDVNVSGTVYPYLMRYLAVHRPVLLRDGEDHGALWSNIDGNPLEYSTLGLHIQLQTEKLGERTTAHGVRYALATLLAEKDPCNTDIAAAALAHHGERSVNEVYDRSGTLASQAKWLETLNRVGKKLENGPESDPGAKD